MSKSFQGISDRKAVAGIVWLSLLGAFIGNIQPLFLGALSEALNLDAQQLGGLGGAELGGVGLASLIAIIWFPKTNLRIVACLGIAVAIVANAATGFVQEYSSLLFLRFIIGFFGSGVIYALSFGLVGQTTNPDRVVAIAVVLQVTVLAIAMLAIPVLLANWQLPGLTLTIALLMCTGLVAIPFLPAHSIPTNTGNSLQTTSAFSFIALGLLFATVVFNTGLGSVWAFLERIGDHAGFSAQDIGSGLAIGSLLGGLGALLAAIIGQRFGRTCPLLISLCGIAGSSAYFSMFTSWGEFLIAVCLFNFFWNLSLPYILGAIAIADRSGRCMVLVPASQGAGLATGPVLAGWLIVGAGYTVVGWTAALLFVVCLFIVIPLLRLTRASE